MVRYNKSSVVLSDSIKKGIIKSIETGIVCKDKNVYRLERLFEKRFDVKHAIACNSCTSGLIIALKVLYGKDYTRQNSMCVSLPAFTWFSTGYAVECNGLNKEFIDIDKETWLAEPDPYSENIFISVDVFGSKSKPYTGFDAVYDAAHGFGLSELGHRGVIEVVSLSYTKIVQGMQGGIILTNDDYLDSDIREYVDHYAKLCEVNAAVAIQSIRDYEKNMEQRLRNIDYYRQNISVDFTEQKIPYETNYSVYALLFNSIMERDRISYCLETSGVETKIYYQPLTSELPNTNDIYSRILALPVYPEVEEHLPFICKVINEAL